MATIKSYTDIEQSKKLAETLPLESADMFYWCGNVNKITIGTGIYKDVKNWFLDGRTRAADIPCWSLAALIETIPQEIFDGEYIINITEGINNRWIITYDHFENKSHSFYGLSSVADNLIDACVAIIENLHKHKLL